MLVWAWLGLAAGIIFTVWFCLRANRKLVSGARLAREQVASLRAETSAQVAQARASAKEEARDQLEAWRSFESTQTDVRIKAAAEAIAQQRFSEWKVDSESVIRKDAVKRSGAITAGKVAEHFVPFLEEFKYDPQDARFLGSPIDLVVFDGLSEGKLRQVVFMEVKTAGSFVTPREAQVKDIIDARDVKWEEFRPANNRARERTV